MRTSFLLADQDRCYRAVSSRDRRFDGMFYTAVTSTGIYCRPSCPAVTPRRRNVVFYPSAAAAAEAGFRACRRCQPDATPGSPDWDARADVAGRAMRLIADGLVEREGVPGLAGRLGYSPRHLHRMLVSELGAGPLALARSRRAHAARLLIETTDVAMADVAFAAGFASVRQFNDTVRSVYGATPRQLRATASDRGAPGAGAGRLSLRLATRSPFDASALLGFLGARAVTGIESAGPDGYRRSLALPHGAAIVELRPAAEFVRCELQLDDLRDLAAAVERCRRMLDLDCDPISIGDALAADPVLAPLVAARPGIRVPGQADGFEAAVRAILGQQISVAGARTLAGRLVERFGARLSHPHVCVTHLFPTADQLAGADAASFGVPLPRGRAIVGLAAAVQDGRVRLDRSADRTEVRASLLALPGIGPWTADYVAMRALGDPDVFLAGDLGVRRAMAALGLPEEPKAALARAQRWRPWRSYAQLHLWSNQSSGEPTR
jgi:AraC family transcriptional regulator, regulatory protein of adaptative response / DNA-3-methyladenine glycosylase II